MSSTITALTSGGGLAMAGDTSGQLELKTNNGTTAVTIDTSQRVMINGASAAGSLSVGSTTGSVGIALQPTNGTGVYAYFNSDATTCSFSSNYGTTGKKFNWALQAPDNALNLNSSGQFSISTTSVFGSTAKLVVDSTTTLASYIRNSSAASGATTLFLWSDSANNTSSYMVTGVNTNVGGNGQVVNIYANGNIQNLNNSYGALSDAKLKENIVDATPKLDDLMKVKVRNYNLIGDKTKQIGVVAQELETVFGGLVEESNDTDREGNVLGTTTKGVKYSVFVPMLIKAIQELNAKVDAQALEIQALKGVA
jgi:hypothetical protein